MQRIDRGFEVITSEKRKTNCQIMLPQRQTERSAGYDFYIPMSYDRQMVYPNEVFKIWTDVKAYMNEDEVLEMYIRSSVGIKDDIVIANGTSIIDADYADNKDNDGNICIAIRNVGKEPYIIQGNSRIAQGVFKRYYVKDYDVTLAKRSGGFGHTGR